MKRAALALLLLAGCKVGPEYEPPATPTPAAFDGAAQEGLAADPAVGAWWKELGDPRLVRLIERAVAGNRDVMAAAALVREARAIHAQEKFNLAPTVTGHASYTRQMLSNATFLENVPRDDRTFGYYELGFDAFWELDLFGRVRRSIEAGAAEVEVAEATKRDVLLTLLADVARAWTELKGARYGAAVARRNAELQDETLRFTVARFEAGRGTEFDVERARTDLQATLAAVPPYEAEEIEARNRLAVLLGELPSGFRVDAGEPGPPEALPKRIALGKPEDLLRRRPDIRRAEQRLAGATARIGVATADLFPRVTIGGTYGPQAPTIPGLFEAGAAAYSFGPHISWAAFDLGRVAARIRAADARAEADLHVYHMTVLQAVEETETALARFGRERARRDALAEAVASSERAAALADVRFQAGAIDLLDTLEARRTVLRLQLELVRSQTRTVTALIALYKALGGGWDPDAP
jgi:multidrug efflux system outer membrane protein